LDIKFNEEDIERISAHLNITADQFVEKFLEQSQEDGSDKARQRFSAMMTTAQFMTYGRQCARSIRTRTKRDLYSEQWALPTVRDVSCRFLDRRADAAAKQAEKKTRTEVTEPPLPICPAPDQNARASKPRRVPNVGSGVI